MKKVQTKKQMIEVDVPVVVEDASEEFMDSLGKEIALFCMVYIYSGKLVGVNDTHILLEDCGIVYETGSFQNKQWKDCQRLPTKQVKVRKTSVESWFVVERG